MHHAHAAADQQVLPGDMITLPPVDCPPYPEEGYEVLPEQEGELTIPYPVEQTMYAEPVPARQR
jgi:hypothetical protein